MDRVFNNADSFAMAFDDAWKQSLRSDTSRSLSIEERTKMILETRIQEHPFLLNNPDQARQVADFRIRLLGLD